MFEYEFNEHVMGTALSVALVLDSERTAEDIFHACFERLKAYEAQYSRFREESELSRLNRDRSLVVSPFTITLLKVARDLYHTTDGYFNPLVQIGRFGYARDFELMRGIGTPEKNVPYNTNFNTTLIDEQSRTVTLVDDQELDFGGFLKGYLAEAEARRIEREHPEVKGVIVNIGGDIHTRGRDEHGQVFVFDVKNPLHTTGIPVPLENASLATSGTYRHFWDIGGARMHHILAKDGMRNPEGDIMSASVIHENGATAEAYAKTLLTVAPATLASMVGEDIQYILIHNNGTIDTAL